MVLHMWALSNMKMRTKTIMTQSNKKKSNLFAFYVAHTRFARLALTLALLKINNVETSNTNAHLFAKCQTKQSIPMKFGRKFVNFDRFGKFPTETDPNQLISRINLEFRLSIQTIDFFLR